MAQWIVYSFSNLGLNKYCVIPVSRPPTNFGAYPKVFMADFKK